MNVFNQMKKITNAQQALTVDMRSDTVTKPTKAMRDAMMNAPVGDDVLKEDPTIIALESKIAEMTGKEAGLFVASGTMGNLLSVLAHCSIRGSEAILGSESHIFNYEQANIAQFGGILAHVVATLPNGTFDMENIELRKTSEDFHSPTSKVVCIENTVCRLGGVVLPLQWIDQVGSFCKKNEVALHMDGARVFNASISCGVGVERILQNVDSASICLSKGLGCPVGSLVVGSRPFIKRVEELRKSLGGGWRQAGLLAACGIYALDNNVERLAKDHQRAKRLAKGIAEMKSSNIWVNMDAVQSNMVIMQVNPKFCAPQQLVDRLASTTPGEEEALKAVVNILAFPMGKTGIRMVMHLDLDDHLVDSAIEKLQFIIQEVDSMKS